MLLLLLLLLRSFSCSSCCCRSGCRVQACVQRQQLQLVLHLLVGLAAWHRRACEMQVLCILILSLVRISTVPSHCIAVLPTELLQQRMLRAFAHSACVCCAGCCYTRRRAEVAVPPAIEPCARTWELQLPPALLRQQLCYCCKVLRPSCCCFSLCMAAAAAGCLQLSRCHCCHSVKPTQAPSPRAHTAGSCRDASLHGAWLGRGGRSSAARAPAGRLVLLLLSAAAPRELLLQVAAVRHASCAVVFSSSILANVLGIGSWVLI
jgi:hypothetical protein